ncbi:MAG: hypothetical protein ACTSUE_03665 [Promethearchaeota archaeon]
MFSTPDNSYERVGTAEGAAAVKFSKFAKSSWSGPNTAEDGTILWFDPPISKEARYYINGRAQNGTRAYLEWVYSQPLDSNFSEVPHTLMKARHEGLMVQYQGGEADLLPFKYDDWFRPVNPYGYTGTKENRGAVFDPYGNLVEGGLGKWGPNLAADAVLFRIVDKKWEVALIVRKDVVAQAVGPDVELNKANVEKYAKQQGRSYEEFLNEIGAYALPGGMVDPSDAGQFAKTALREFTEEASGDSTTTRVVTEAFKTATYVTSTYVDDPRNSKHAWMETSVYSAFVPSDLDLKGKDDALDAGWKQITPNLKLYASHSKILDAALVKMQSGNQKKKTKKTKKKATVQNSSFDELPYSVKKTYRSAVTQKAFDQREALEGNYRVYVTGMTKDESEKLEMVLESAKFPAPDFKLFGGQVMSLMLNLKTKSNKDDWENLGTREWNYHMSYKNLLPWVKDAIKPTITTNSGLRDWTDKYLAYTEAVRKVRRDREALFYDYYNENYKPTPPPL